MSIPAKKSGVPDKEEINRIFSRIALEEIKLARDIRMQANRLSSMLEELRCDAESKRRVMDLINSNADVERELHDFISREKLFHSELKKLYEDRADSLKETYSF